MKGTEIIRAVESEICGKAGGGKAADKEESTGSLPGHSIHLKEEASLAWQDKILFSSQISL